MHRLNLGLCSVFKQIRILCKGAHSSSGIFCLSRPLLKGPELTFCAWLLRCRAYGFLVGTNNNLSPPFRRHHQIINSSYIQQNAQKKKVLVPVKPIFTGLWYRVISSVTLVGGQGSNGDQGWVYMCINRAPKCNRENDCQYRSRWTYLETNGMKPRHQTPAAWLQESHSAATSAL